MADTSDVAHSEDVTPLCALPAPPPPLSLHAVADTLFAVKPRRLTSVELACEFESFAEYIAETRLPRGDHAEVGRSYYFTVSNRNSNPNPNPNMMTGESPYIATLLIRI